MNTTLYKDIQKNINSADPVLSNMRLVVHLAKKYQGKKNQANSWQISVKSVVEVLEKIAHLKEHHVIMMKNPV